MLKVKALVINPKDNVATAIDDIKANSKVLVKIGEKTVEVLVKQDIPFGHKFALKKIGKGEEIVKYGECIGVAKNNIEEGEHVHIHNVESTRAKGGE